MSKNIEAEVGVVVGRFQCDDLHEGHREVIDHVRKTHPRVFIFLGQAPLKNTAVNPLDFQSRRWMVEDVYSDVEVHRIDDVGDDERWSRELDRQIDLLIGPGQRVVLYGSRESFIKGYKGKYATEELVATKQVSATEIRKRIGVKAKKSREFRQGMIHAAQNRFPTVYTTVDMAGCTHDYRRLLLGRKPNEYKWRFPGGFSDIISKSFEEDASREYVEETHVVVPFYEWTYVCSTLVDDWRYRHEQDKIKTLLFVADLRPEQADAALAGDDLAEVQWFHIDQIDEKTIVPNHVILLNKLRTWINSRTHRIP